MDFVLVWAGRVEPSGFITGPNPPTQVLVDVALARYWVPVPSATVLATPASAASLSWSTVRRRRDKSSTSEIHPPSHRSPLHGKTADFPIMWDTVDLWHATRGGSSPCLSGTLSRNGRVETRSHLWRTCVIQTRNRADLGHNGWSEVIAHVPAMSGREISAAVKLLGQFFSQMSLSGCVGVPDGQTWRLFIKEGDFAPSPGRNHLKYTMSVELAADFAWTALNNTK